MMVEVEMQVLKLPRPTERDAPQHELALEKEETSPWNRELSPFPAALSPFQLVRTCPPPAGFRSLPSHYQPTPILSSPRRAVWP